MKPIAGIEAPEVSEAEIVHRWDLASGREERAEKTLAESRLEKGRILVEARKMYAARGPRAKGWGDLLRKLRVEERTALRYMELAGHVGEVSDNVSEIPTYAEAGITARAARSTAEISPVAELPGSPVSSRSSLQASTDDKTASIAPVSARDRQDALSLNVVSENWADDMEQIAEAMIRSARSLFGNAERLDALCRQKSAAISSAKLASIPTHLLAAQAAIAATLRVFKGDAS